MPKYVDTQSPMVTEPVVQAQPVRYAVQPQPMAVRQPVQNSVIVRRAPAVVSPQRSPARVIRSGVMSPGRVVRSPGRGVIGGSGLVRGSNAGTIVRRL